MTRPAAPEQRTIDVDLEHVQADDRTLRGHAAVFNVLSEDLGGFRERIAPGAFRDVLGADVRLLVNHKPDHVLARTRAGTLRLSEDTRGLAVEADLPDTTYARDLRESLRRGDLDGMSFRFKVGEEDWSNEDGGEVRTVRLVERLEDVCLATYPAYPAASVELRTRAGHTNPPPEGGTDPEEATVPEQNREGGLRVEDRAAHPDDTQTLEARVVEAIRSIRKGESRALSTTTAAAVVPEDQATYLWDRLRAASIALASGVRVIPTTRHKVTWPRLVSDVDPSWVAELEQIPAGDPGFSSLEAIPRKLAHRVTDISNEVIDDSEPSIVDVLNAHLVAMLALKLDLGIFEGNQAADADSIKGIKYVTGIQTLSMGTNGAAVANYDAFIRAVGKLRAANVPGPYAIAAHPDVLTELELLKNADGQQLAVPANFPPIYTSSQLSTTETQGSSNTARSAYVYAPAQVVLVRRLDAEIELDRSRLFDKDASEMRGKARADLIVPNPTAVVRITGITPPA